jgi:response regulator RpfG family c-di-GMP phosphodiesterase
MISRFFLIDDDPVNNALCKMLIRTTIENADVKTFRLACDALTFIKCKSNKKNDEPDSIVFLDLNMPDMTGWEFIELFEEIDKEVKNKLRVYILSSSLDPKDKKRAIENKNIIDYITKPITKEIILEITSGKVSTDSPLISP